MREADVAIRMSPPRQPDLIQRHLVSVQVHIYAAPEYIKKHGMPQRPEDLDKHRLIVYGEDSRPPVQGVNWLLDAGAKPGQRAPADPEPSTTSTAMLRAVQERAGPRLAARFRRGRAHRSGARAAGDCRAAERGLFRLSGRAALLEADQRVPRFPAAQGGREPAQLTSKIDSRRSGICGSSEHCGFCRRARTKFPVVACSKIGIFRARDTASQQVFRGRCR